MKQPIINKRFIVRKYIMAKSAKEAIKKDKTTMPDDVWVDDEWKKENPNQLVSAIGFLTTSDRDYYDYEDKK